MLLTFFGWSGRFPPCPNKDCAALILRTNRRKLEMEIECVNSAENYSSFVGQFYEYKVKLRHLKGKRKLLSIIIITIRPIFD